MSRSRVLVHVGAPKTGTSFVQDLLFRRREELALEGVLYPADRFDEHFLAALDLLELPWGGLERQAVGAWDRLAERVRGWPSGTVIVSHEILAIASGPQVRRALDSFGDAEVHVVLSARDLVRQLPAEWQENVKHRRTLTYRDFLAKVAAPERVGPLASWFWGVQEVPAVLERWGAALPPDRVHLVTVPRPGAPRDLLWERFASVFGLDPATVAAGTQERANASLGVAEAALVRRLNERLNGGVLANEPYREFVRELLAHRTLSRRDSAARLTLPPEVHAWAAGVCQEWVASLAGRGYDVVGDLAELLPEEGTAEFIDPDKPDEGEVADASMESLVTLLRELARLREEANQLAAELHDARREPPGVLLRARQRVVRAADTSAPLGLALAAYRRVRRR